MKVIRMAVMIQIIWGQLLTLNRTGFLFKKGWRGGRGGVHSKLCYDTSSKWVSFHLMPHCGRGCHIINLIMVPISFWQNSQFF